MILTRTLAACCLVLPLALHAQQPPCPTAPVADHGKSENGQPLASPAATAEATLAGKPVRITYNSPSMRCRKIFGGEVVPFDQPWRTGANPATTLTTAADLTLGTLTVPAGTYTLYTLPEAAPKPWLLIVNKQTGQWGTVYKPEMDLGRTPMHFHALATPQEHMSLTFEHVEGAHAELHIRWENTDVSLPVTAR